MVMVTNANDDNVLIMLFRAVEKYIIIIIIIKMRTKFQKWNYWQLVPGVFFSNNFQLWTR